jgi:hypothetical protein
MSCVEFLNVAEDLEIAGLVWRPEIGDEVLNRQNRNMISILVDPQGMTPSELRATYLWLPTLEQMVNQFEARSAIIFHVGLELSDTALFYKTVIKATHTAIETRAETMRSAFGLALRDLLLIDNNGAVN